MNRIFFIILLSFPIFIYGQTCNCPLEIKEVIKQVEDNAASYQHQVVEGNKSYEYQKHKKQILKYSQTVTTQKECLGLTAFYLYYIKDGHSYMTFSDTHLPYKSFNDTVTIQKFYENDETIISAIRTAKKSIEGTWHFQDGSFSIAITKTNKNYRKYAGLMLFDKNPFWKKGNVKLEIVKNYKNELGCIYWTQNRMPKYYSISIRGDEMHIGNTFKFYRSKPSASNQRPTESTSNKLEFQSLSSQTNYIRIPSFDLSFSKEIEAIISENITAILSKPNFIIDLRNNGGGGFDAFTPLLPFVADEKKLQEPYSASIWVSSSTLKYYDDTKFDYAETKEDSLFEQQYLDDLKPFVNKWKSATSTDSITIASLYLQPKNVILLVNKGCASTTEGFVLIAKQSKKVQLFGENTMGTINYGDIRFIEFPKLGIQLATTTKKMIFNYEPIIEAVGIKPHRFLDTENWIVETMKIIEK